ncbi:MAG: hypothetical protein GY803_05625 [Chloroflexi bacterium]|nr:hypothetical protein [Chloroflexota bacterium]
MAVTPDSGVVGTWTAVYFTYTASPAYFERLANHTDFANISEFNTAVSPISCASLQMPDDFSYWTDQPIALEGKECYTGVYFPYAHFLIYAPETQEAHHFVSGMRG